MNGTVAKTLAQISVFVFFFLLVHNLYTYVFLNSSPWEGDSIDYHIPIAEKMVSGQLIFTDAIRPQMYYPAANEITLALYKILNLPINTYNILAWIALTIACFVLAKSYKLENYYALLFAMCIATLNVIVRWVGAQTIDIWLAFYFVTTIVILKTDKPTIKRSLLLGISFGMLIGSKYTALPYALILAIFYRKELYRYVKKINRLLIFTVPVFALGLFWYVRNFFLFGNPFYPLKFLGLPSADLFSDNVWKISLHYPIEMTNAFIAEYKIYSLLIILLPFIFYFLFKQKVKQFLNTRLLFLLALLLLIFYPLFPTSSEAWIMVSSLRYSYPAFIILILGTFLLAQNLKRESILAFLVVANMISLHPLEYFPKLTFIYIPAAFLAVYFFDKKYETKNSNNT